MYRKIYDDCEGKDFDYWAFYVPKRIFWNEFEKFIGKEKCNEKKKKSIEMEK